MSGRDDRSPALSSDRMARRDVLHGSTRSASALRALLDSGRCARSGLGRSGQSRSPPFQVRICSRVRCDTRGAGGQPLRSGAGRFARSGCWGVLDNRDRRHFEWVRLLDPADRNGSDFDRLRRGSGRPPSVQMSSIIFKFKRLGLFLDEECPHHDVSSMSRAADRRAVAADHDVLARMVIDLSTRNQVGLFRRKVCTH